MEQKIEKYTEHIRKAESSLKTADHLVYITFPLIKENRLLKKILESIGDTAYGIFRGILEYEAKYRRIDLSENDKLNFEVFRRCSARYDLTGEEITMIQTIFELINRYKESSFEFIRKDKLVIMSENLRTESVNIDQLKKFLNCMKGILVKTHAIIDEKQEFEKREIRSKFKQNFRI